MSLYTVHFYGAIISHYVLVPHFTNSPLTNKSFTNSSVINTLTAITSLSPVISNKCVLLSKGILNWSFLIFLSFTKKCKLTEPPGLAGQNDHQGLHLCSQVSLVHTERRNLKKTEFLPIKALLWHILFPKPICCRIQNRSANGVMKMVSECGAKEKK